MKRPSVPVNRFGNTIAEVLIAMAVISSVLAGAFAVSQKSVISVRGSQEQSEVLQILQTQVENVRSLALAQKTETGGIFAPGEFCIIYNAGAYSRIASTDNACKNLQNRYDISGTYDSSSRVFTFTGSWEDLSGDRQSQKLTYRVHSGAPVTPVPSGGPLSGGGGDAFFDNGRTCDQPGQPSCSADTSGGRYQYDVRYFNQSQNQSGTILGCTWDWGDGTVESLPGSDVRCQYGGPAPHTYPTLPDEQPFPISCGDKTYRITLTMRIQGVSPDPSWRQYADLPYCGS